MVSWTQKLKFEFEQVTKEIDMVVKTHEAYETRDT